MRNMRINDISIIRTLLIFNIIAWYHLGYLFKLPGIINTLLLYNNLSFISALVANMCFIYCICKHNAMYISVKNKLLFYYIGVCGIYFLLVVYTLLKYPSQGVFSTIREGTNYLQILMVPAYVAVFCADGGVKRTMKHINYISFVWYVLAIVQFVEYKIGGILLFDFATYFNNSPVIRLYGLRIGVGCFGALMILYNYICLYEASKSIRDKVFNIVQLVLGLFVVIYIQQTRMIIIVIFLCLIVCIFLCKKSPKIRRRELLAMIFLFLLLCVSGYFNNLLEEMLYIDTIEGNVSYSNRLYSINYYWECFKNNVLVGNAFVADSLYYYSVVHGPMGVAHYSDVGIIGMLGQIGLCSLIFFGMPFFYLISVLRKLRHNFKTQYGYNILVMSLLYIGGTSITLLVTDYARTPMFAFIIAVAMYFDINLAAQGNDTLT